MKNTPRANIRRRLRRLSLAAGALGATFLLPLPHALAATFDLSTATIDDIQAAMNSGALSSEKLVQLYLDRIAAYDQQGPKLNTVISFNKKALAAPSVTPPLSGEKFNYTPNAPKGARISY